jgi:Protein of unknown function (DUF3108)
MALDLNRALVRATPRRRLAWAALVIAVVVVHGCVTQHVVERLADIGADAAMPARIEVAYVREMALAAPPPTAAPAAPVSIAPVAPIAPPPARARPPKPAASMPASAPAPELAEPALAVSSRPEPTPEVVAEPEPQVAPPPAPPDTTLAEAPAPPIAAEPASAAASDALAAFEWPASTRMSYLLTGNYRGEVNGSAQVEWVRAGSRYQVHLDLLVGPSIAPIITRRMTSDGEITAEGLSPRRYDQDTKVVLRERNRRTITFEPGAVVLANGERRGIVPGVQDTASQFVQLTYIFSTRPELLRAGGTVDIPLALPHKVDVWTYDVIGEEVLDTPFGPLPSIHLKPRRAPLKAGELSAEIWFAPQLRYLPVRIRIEQDADNYLDLMISKPPEIAG